MENPEKAPIILKQFIRFEGDIFDIREIKKIKRGDYVNNDIDEQLLFTITIHTFNGVDTYTYPTEDTCEDAYLSLCKRLQNTDGVEMI